MKPISVLSSIATGLIFLMISGCVNPEEAASFCELTYGRPSVEGDLAPEVRACQFGVDLAHQVERSELSDETARKLCDEQFSPQNFIHRENENEAELLIQSESHAKACVCDQYLYYHPNPRGINFVRDYWLDIKKHEEALIEAYKEKRKKEGRPIIPEDEFWFDQSEVQDDSVGLDDDWRLPVCSDRNAKFTLPILQSDSQASWIRAAGALTQCLSACESGYEMTRKSYQNPR